MRVVGILRRLLAPRLGSVHAVRLTAVFAVAEAISIVGRLSVAAVGRGLAGPVHPKHSIKRVDRLLSNSHLPLELTTFYAAIARVVTRGEHRPLVVLDWTQMVGQLWALVAAVPVAGRAVPIYGEVHHLKRGAASPPVEAAFLHRLKRVLPEDARPIVVADAGFRRPFFEEVLKLGWDYVGRLRGNRVLVGPRGRVRPNTLTRSANATPRDLGRYELSPYSNCRRQHSWPGPFVARLVTVYRRSERRRAPPKQSRCPNSMSKQKAIRANREPWLLATSLQRHSANSVAAIYGGRMSIEQTFRDTKNHRWGWCLRDVRCNSAQRLNALLLLVSIAFFALGELGLAAARQGRERRYRANTGARRAISIFVLGALLLRRGDTPPSSNPRGDYG